MQQRQKAGKAANRGTNYEKQHVTAKRNKTKERVRKSLVTEYKIRTFLIS